MKIQVGSAGQFGFLMLKQSLVFQFALPEEQERSVSTDHHNTLICLFRASHPCPVLQFIISLAYPMPVVISSGISSAYFLAFPTAQQYF